MKTETTKLIGKGKRLGLKNEWRGPVWVTVKRAPWHVPCWSPGSWWTVPSGAVPGAWGKEGAKAGLMALGGSLSGYLLLVPWMASVDRARRSWRRRFCDSVSPRADSSPGNELLSWGPACRDSCLGN